MVQSFLDSSQLFTSIDRLPCSKSLSSDYILSIRKPYSSYIYYIITFETTHRSSGMLYHPSWRTSLSCWRWEAVPHASLQNWPEWFNGVQIWWLCPYNRDWTVPAVWMGALSSWKTASFLANNIWIMGCSTWLPNLSIYSLAVIWPWRVMVGPTE
jgi:hypothetical protein